MINKHIECNNCDFGIVGPESKFYVLRNEGKQVHIGFPCSADQYEKLISSGQVIRRYGFLCLNCGELNYFGPFDLGQSEDTFDELLIRDQINCSECKNRALLSINDKKLVVRDWLQSLLQVLQLQKPATDQENKIICPRCKKGQLGAGDIVLA